MGVILAMWIQTVNVNDKEKSEKNWIFDLYFSVALANKRHTVVIH